MSSQAENITKLFGMTTQLIADDLCRVEERFAIELGHLPKMEVKESEYYPCLEKSIRRLIAEQMADDAEDWWASGKIPATIDTEVKKRMKKEIDAGVTQRSTDKLDYTTFGELSIVITSNWDVFGSVFTSQKAVERVLSGLNTLRGPIAHCSAISDDEALRLRLAVRDWFRIMGSNKAMDGDEA